VGKATRQLDFAILAGPTGTGWEPNLVKKIKRMLDSCTNLKTMGHHIMGYVGAQEQQTPFRRTGTTTNTTLGSQHPDSDSLCGWHSAATTRHIALVVQTNQDNT